MYYAMMATISLVNICFHAELQIVCVYPMRTFKKDLPLSMMW